MTEKRDGNYGETITFRVPKAVDQALKQYVKDKQEDFPRFNEADECRAALVAHLKSKKYLKEDVNYL